MVAGGAMAGTSGGPWPGPLPRPAAGESALDLVRRAGTVFAVFDRQDSGCVSYGVVAGGARWFVKTAASTEAAASLRSAYRFHAAVRHRAVLPLAAAVQVGDSPVLAYPWFGGEVLYHSTIEGAGSRTDPASPWARLRALPVRRVEAVVEELLDAHRAVSAAGFVAVDLYDGSMMYDFATQTFRLVDLDEYRPGPFVAHRRLPGSRRFMAPEEYGGGATVDERTTVHVLGRAVRLLLDVADEEGCWRGTDAQLAVVERATRAVPAERFRTVAGLHDAWRAASLR